MGRSPSRPVTSPASQHYEHDGFCFTPVLVPAAVCEAAAAGATEVVRGEYETGVPPYKREWEPGDDPTLLIKIAQPHYCNRAIHDLVTHPEIGAWAAAIVGARLVQAFAVDLFVKRPARHDDANVGWHQDSPFLQPWPGEVFTAWIALSDVTEDAAPLLYIRGSHRLGELEGTDFFDTDLDGRLARMALPAGFQPEVVPTVFPMGAMAFHHRHTLHASGPNRTPEPRVTIAMRLLTERCQPDLASGHPLVHHLDDPVAAPVVFRSE